MKNKLFDFQQRIVCFISAHVMFFLSVNAVGGEKTSEITSKQLTFSRQVDIVRFYKNPSNCKTQVTHLYGLYKLQRLEVAAVELLLTVSEKLGEGHWPVCLERGSEQTASETRR